MARLRRIEPPPDSFASISTPLLSSSGSSTGSSIGGRVEVKFVYDAGAGAALDGVAEEVGVAGGGYWIAVRKVPLTALPESVTWATLFAFAWARKAEYGIPTDGTDVGAKIRTAFHTSRPTKIAADNQGGIRMRPGRGPGPGPDGVGSFPEGDGGLGVAGWPPPPAPLLGAAGGPGGAPPPPPPPGGGFGGWPPPAGGGRPTKTGRN